MAQRGEESRDRSSILLEGIPEQRYEQAFPRVHYFLTQELPAQIRRSTDDPSQDSLFFRTSFGPEYSGRVIAHILRVTMVRPQERSIPLVSLAKYDPQTQRVVFRITTTVRDAFLSGRALDCLNIPSEIEDEPEEAHEPGCSQHYSTTQTPGFPPIDAQGTQSGPQGEWGVARQYFTRPNCKQIY